MLEIIGALAVSYWTILILGFLVTLQCHYDHEGWSLFFLILLGLASYFAFSMPAIYIFYSALAYIPIGIAWAIFKWDRYCKKCIEIEKKSDRKTREWGYTSIQKELDPKMQIWRISNWIIAWPFSAIGTVFSGIIDAIEDFVERYIIGIFSTISNKYLSNLPDEK